MISRPIWNSMSIRSDDIGWSHDQICGDMWRGTYENYADLTKFSVMWIGKYVTGSFHDQFQELYWFELMLEHDVMTYFEVLIWSAMCIGIMRH
jgi:hypothetical protein